MSELRSGHYGGPISGSCDDENCKVFFPGFLNCLGQEERKKFVESYHKMEKGLVDDPVAEFEIVFTSYINSVRLINPEVHCVLALKFLNRFNNDEKRKVVQILDEKDDKDFWTYLIIERLDEDLKEFKAATTAMFAALELVQDGEEVKKTFVQVKLANCLWYDQRDPSFREYQANGLRLLDNFKPRLSQITDPASEEAVLLSMAYETMANLLIEQSEAAQSRAYAENYLEINKPSWNPGVHLQALLFLAELGNGYAYSCPEYSLKYLDLASVVMEAIVKDDTLVENHFFNIADFSSKVGHAFRITSFRLDRFVQPNIYRKALNAQLKAQDVLEKYVTDRPSMLARSASEIAMLYFNVGINGQSDQYIAKAESFLADSGYMNDPTKKKLLVIEVIETLRNLGNVYRERQDLVEAQRMYQRGLDVSESVFGTEHKKTAMLYRNMGHLHLKLRQVPDAEAYFKKAIEVHRALGNQEAMERVQKDLMKTVDFKNKNKPRRYNKY